MTTLVPPAPTADAHAAGAMLGHLFDEHGRMVLGVCRIYLHDVYEAEDAAQDTFVSAHRSLLSGRQPEQAGPWLAAIARNECRDRIRRNGRQKTATAPAETFERMPATTGDGVTDQIAYGASLQQALADLPESQREAFVLREMLGLRYDEIAKALDTTESAVESLLVRARRGLQNHLLPLRLAPVALVVPFALRESIAHAVVGFPVGTAASAGTTATVAGAGSHATSGGASATTSGTAGATGTTPAVGVGATGGTAGVGVGTGAAVTTSASAFAGLAAAIATPVLAKLVVVGAATTVAATMAISKPWDVATRQTEATPAAEIAAPASGDKPVSDPPIQPTGSGSAAPGNGRDVEDSPAGNQSQKPDNKKGEQKKGSKNKGPAKSNGNRDSTSPPESGDAEASGAATVAAVQTGENPPAVTADNGSSDKTVGESTQADPPESATETTGEAPSKAKSNNRDGAKKSKTGKSSHGKKAPTPDPAGDGKKKGHEADGPGNSNDASGKAQTVGKNKHADGGSSQSDAPPTESSIDADAEDKKKKKKKKTKGKKRGHEEDGPGNSNDANGKAQTVGKNKHADADSDHD